MLYASLLYIVLFLHQTTTKSVSCVLSMSCISYYSYIKPQQISITKTALDVVYRTIPTSNHNSASALVKIDQLYIVLFLHQTTTYVMSAVLATRCISYYSYIKPQLRLIVRIISSRCISYYSYIKPQLYHPLAGYSCVVYRTIPTSNHNL